MAEGFSDSEFAVETWTLYSVGMCLIFTRLVSQARRLGIRNMRSDDYVMITVIPWYTLLVVSINKIIFGGGSNFMTPEEIAALTPTIKAQRVVGSKWVLLSEEVMVMSIWTCKVCMLLIYGRLTEGLDQKRIINGVFVYTAAGFVATHIALFTTCRPFSGYWSVPAINDQCWSYFNFEIVEATFNISSDLMVLLVAIHLLAKLHMPIQQKAILLGIFGMGLFIIAAAILTKVYSLDPNLVSYAYLNWYFREASVSVYVTNGPAIWALTRDLFPSVKYWGYQTRTTDLSSYTKGTRSRTSKSTWRKATGSTWAEASRERGSKNGDPLELFDGLGSKNCNEEEGIDLRKMGSQVHILPQNMLQNEESEKEAEEGGVGIYKNANFSQRELKVFWAAIIKEG
ncbi:UbiD family decarboxylase [Xylogone sp. PMI_703]|nr:UbiD family decarboxylase [Xylogone sp. PMI_703]